jgi:predicted metalloprotease with PDZ domain
MMLLKLLFSFLFLFLFIQSVKSKPFKEFKDLKKNQIQYTLSFSKPQNNYCDVEILASTNSEDSLLFSMPVWTPGSYLVREFGRHVERVKAHNENGKELEVFKTNKNTWQVNCGGASEVKLTYSVYCNELTVRTSQVNIDHAFISSSGVFMFVRGRLDNKCIIKINPYKDWKEISTGLRKTGKNKYEADNYDTLVDCPIEIGNQEIIKFTVSGKKHYICMAGKGNYNSDTIKKDFKKIVEVEKDLFGDLPYEDFTFIILLVKNGGGGLEHKNSFAAIGDRNLFDNPERYKRFLSLISHEFFHLWNVKRIRPVALGPFDYDNENYTKMHYVTEGWTSFYDNIFLRRAGILNDDEYIEYIERDVNDIMRFSGRFKQSLEESSFDNWIKYYRQDENNRNSQVSYYTKGALVAMMLDIEIIRTTNGKKSLDNVLKLLWQDYKNNPERGYDDARIKELSEQVSGKNLNTFWKNYISGTKDLPLKEYLGYAGIDMTNKNADDKISLDVEYTVVSDSIIQITKVYEGGTGFEAGLNFRDRIISINRETVTKANYDALLNANEIGDELIIRIDRDGLEKEINVTLLTAIPVYKLSLMKFPTENQLKVFNKWIKG